MCNTIIRPTFLKNAENYIVNQKRKKLILFENKILQVNTDWSDTVRRHLKKKVQLGD